MTNEQRIELERKIVRKMIRIAKEAGWNVSRVDDGGDEDEPVGNETEAMDAIFAVDEARLKFSNGHARHTVLIVLGNGIDVICDWSYVEGDGDGFNAMMEKVCAYVSKLEQEQ